MAESFIGTWQTIASENMGAVLEAIGSPFLVRNIATRVKPVQVIAIDGNMMNIKNETGFTTSENTIPLDGTEYCEKTNLFPLPFCGRTILGADGIITTEGLVGDKPLKITRKLIDTTKMELVTVTGDIIGTRLLERKPS